MSHIPNRLHIISKCSQRHNNCLYAGAGDFRHWPLASRRTQSTAESLPAELLKIRKSGRENVVLPKSPLTIFMPKNGCAFTLRVRIYSAVVEKEVEGCQQCLADPADLPAAQQDQPPSCLYTEEPGEANASRRTLVRQRHHEYLLHNELRRLQYNCCTEDDHTDALVLPFSLRRSRRLRPGNVMRTTSLSSLAFKNRRRLSEWATASLRKLKTSTGNPVDRESSCRTHPRQNLTHYTNGTTWTIAEKKRVGRPRPLRLRRSNSKLGPIPKNTPTQERRCLRRTPSSRARAGHRKNLG